MAESVIYLVQRLSWRVGESGGDRVEASDERTDIRECPHDSSYREIVVYHRCEDEGGVPLRAFVDYAQAQAFRREQEQAHRARTNPFRYGHDLPVLTSLDEGRLRDWLLDAGLTPPGHEGEEDPTLVAETWRKWWKKQHERLDEKLQLELARTLNNGLANRSYGQPDAEGRTDVAWLDEHFNAMDRLTPLQRSCIRSFIFLLCMSLRTYPEDQGERDERVIIDKWRYWWDVESLTMTPWQREKVWEALDKVRLYEVIELPQDG